MTADRPNKDDLNLDSVVSGSITISALLAGFVLVFVGLVLSDAANPSLLQLLTLFLASLLFEFFYRAMVKSWNLLAVRALARIGDRILDGSLKEGPEYAAFRALWAFQPKMYQGSWLMLALMALYGATKSWWNVLPIVAGFLTGLVFYSVLAERSWKRTWRRCSAWDKSVYLGELTLPGRLPFHQRLFMRISALGKKSKGL
ncbi:MAG: hypothetical protein IMZ69_00850 [Spirochaetes bacterium]|nr:hypothetical protein [Spirochaetota bacterium]